MLGQWTNLRVDPHTNPHINIYWIIFELHLYTRTKMYIAQGLIGRFLRGQNCFGSKRQYSAMMCYYECTFNVKYGLVKRSIKKRLI